MWRKTVLATAIVGAGLASTTGSAFAGEASHDSETASHHAGHGQGHENGGEHHGKKHGKGHGKHHSQHDEGDDPGKDCAGDIESSQDEGPDQHGLVNVSDVQTTAPIQACNNNVPTNVGGVQVPIQDAVLNLPILSESGDDGGNSAGE